MGLANLSQSRFIEGAPVREWLARMTPDDIEDALALLEFLETGGQMDADEATAWRWKLLACWAEQERRRKRVAARRGAA